VRLARAPLAMRARVSRARRARAPRRPRPDSDASSRNPCVNRVSFQTSSADARALEPRRVDRSISSNLDASIDDRVEASIARDGGIFQSSLERARSFDDVDARRCRARGREWG
jgi:hypothetical protein